MLRNPRNRIARQQPIVDDEMVGGVPDLAVQCSSASARIRRGFGSKGGSSAGLGGGEDEHKHFLNVNIGSTTSFKLKTKCQQEKQKLIVTWR